MIIIYYLYVLCLFLLLFCYFLSLKLNILGFTKGLCLNLQIFDEFSFYFNSSLLKFLCSNTKIVRSSLSDNIILLDLFCMNVK